MVTATLAAAALGAFFDLRAGDLGASDTERPRAA